MEEFEEVGILVVEVKNAGADFTMYLRDIPAVHRRLDALRSLPWITANQVFAQLRDKFSVDVSHKSITVPPLSMNDMAMLQEMAERLGWDD